jgi:undecaprenyl-phosphate 4-deoxy-4-formamido-L-arabinose transferase
MDDDLQHPPEEIPRLLEEIRSKQLDLVYGSYDTKKHRPWRNLGSALVIGFYRYVFKVPVTLTAFRIMRRQLVQSVLSYNLNFTFVDGLLAWNTQRIGEIIVNHQPRAAGRSGYSLTKLMVLALNLFTNFSLIPLQLVSFVGFFAAAGGLGMGLYYLLQFLFSNITVPGYASTIIAVLVRGGIQLLALGIMGEYLGRLHLNVNRKPQFTVRQVIGQDQLRLTGTDAPPLGDLADRNWRGEVLIRQMEGGQVGSNGGHPGNAVRGGS